MRKPQVGTLFPKVRAREARPDGHIREPVSKMVPQCWGVHSARTATGRQADEEQSFDSRVVAFDGEVAMSEAIITTNHNEIRQWVELMEWGIRHGGLAGFLEC